jgi:adenylate cyclase
MNKIVAKRFNRRLRKASSNAWFASILIILVTTAFTFGALTNLRLIELAENYLSDLRIVLLSPARAQSQRIAVVLIDEKSLAHLPYRSPIDRSFIANLISDLEHRSVVAIGLNVLFNRQTEPDKDDVLYQKLRNVKTPVVITQISSEAGYSIEQIEFSKDYLKGLHTGLSLIYRDTSDHTVRVSLLKLYHEGIKELGFASKIAEILGINLPTEEKISIDYRLGTSPAITPFPIYSASEVTDLPRSALEHRIVLIGSDLGASSRLRTPFSLLNDGTANDIPGVIIEAHVLSQLIENRRLNEPSQFQIILITVLMISIGCLLSMVKVRLTIKLVISLSLLPLAWVAALAIFIADGLLVPMITPTIAYVLAIVISLFWQWRNEILMREKVHHTFGQFMAPDVVTELLQNSDELELTAELREITLLFTDLEGFTSLTESTEPLVMVRLLNSYLEEACDIVITHGGTIDKIVGDALHVMFNAPQYQTDHATRAVRCAIEIDTWSASFRKRQQENGIKLGVTRIGVNTGNCVVGNFGGKKRLDYTAHGDAINSAARLEAINQRLGTTVCVSEYTVKQCKGIYFRSIATLVLRGKTIGIKTYTPHFGSRDPNAPSILYEHVYDLLTDNDITSATLLNELASLYPKDPLVSLHLARVTDGATDTTIIISKK